jgi:MoxR-like ATPase
MSKLEDLRNLLSKPAPAKDKLEPWMSPAILPLLPPPVASNRAMTEDWNRENAKGPNKDTYRFSPEHKRAIQVALLLRQPLLLTGEPGVGKTQSARALARALEVRYDRFDVKSTTTGRDLLYSFDDVARFRDASIARVKDKNEEEHGEDVIPGLAKYVELSALGRAIVLSAGADTPIHTNVSRKVLLGTATGEGPITLREVFPTAFYQAAQAQSLVLVDELDKAPRDTPNDLLVEFDEMRLRIPELGDLQVEASIDYWPIVIVTSNSERSLPDPFLRRCVFHHLTLEPDSLSDIILLKLPDLDFDSSIEDLIEIFKEIRERLPELQKPPSTGELVGAAALLRAWPRSNGAAPRIMDDESLQKGLASVLGKIQTDVELIEKYMTQRRAP